MASSWQRAAGQRRSWQEWCRSAAAGARAARPGARVIYRTAAAPSPLDGQVPDAIMEKWDYRREESLRFTTLDRSAIYGGFHLHLRKGA